MLLNPLVYMTEGFRGALTTIPHMPWWGVYLALFVALAFLMRAGLRGFAKRVLA